MKVIILVIISFVVWSASFAQNSSIKEVNSEYYLHKSKVKRTIGYTFLGSGVALFITGGIIDRVERPELLAGFTCEAAGVASALISIPFFISGSVNKGKALLLTVNTQHVMMLKQNAELSFLQPAATLKIIF